MKEQGDGRPFLLVETLEGSLGVLDSLSLTIDLIDDIDLSAAQDIARELNRKVRSVAVTD